MYFLPDKIGGVKLKKVDLLSDIRMKKESFVLDSLKYELEKADSLVNDSLVALPVDTAESAEKVDSLAINLRDSLYQVMQLTWKDGDSSEVWIEDFAPGHTGLKNFFDAFKKANELNRPVRIAFLGDSFIEGDIMVADFRAALQQHFGGHGVGFVPLASNVAQFRPTIEHHFSGWNSYTLISHKKYKYALPCVLFDVSGEKATAKYKMVNKYACLEPVTRISLLYERSNHTDMQLVYNDIDTIIEKLPDTEVITEYSIEGEFKEVNFTFTNADTFRGLGVIMEDKSGIIVDNFSLRGNSGMSLKELDFTRCEELNKIRPYDLLILQYGLNVAAEGVLQYGWYRQQMVSVIEHLKYCFPQADILVLGVSDRSYQENGKFTTMPAVLSLLYAQRQLAKQTHVTFWNTFRAMGGENSMVRYVNNNWASKDYTHLGFRGGREIASSLVKAILLEKQFYDEADEKTW